MLIRHQGKPADRDVLVIRLQTDIVTMRSSNPERVNRLAVILSTWILLRACDEEPLLVVLANEREDFVYAPARLCVLVEERWKLPDAHPWPVKPEFVGTDASLRDARERGLEVVCVRPPPHFQHIGLAKLLEFGDRQLVVEVRVGAEHFIEIIVVLRS